jgi:predicted amino acid racemase
VNHLRLGEAILLGREPLHRRPIEGLHTDAFTLVGEVIESKAKPSRAWGELGETAFGAPPTTPDVGTRTRVLVGLGRQDVDPAGLEPPPGTTLLGASSDHLVLDGGETPWPVGAELRFRMGYGALLAAMTSPFVGRSYTRA